jgi:hypothetical protein
MVSSTYLELSDHRKAVREAILGQRMLPLAMEDDAALPDKDLIDASLAKVDEADAYVGLIGYRYGQVPECPERNPDRLSITELEFRRAVERRIPLCMFIMHDDHPVPKRGIREDHGSLQKLDSFIQLARKDRIYAEFDSVTDLKVKAIQSMGALRERLAALRAAAAPSVAQNPVSPPAHLTSVPVDRPRPEPDAANRTRQLAPPPKRPSFVLVSIIFFGLSAICAWALSLLAAEKDVSWVAVSLFLMGFVFFAAAGIFSLRRRMQQRG